MLVLGIETSCDETAAAVVEATPDGGWRERSNVVASQVAIHAEWGGVVPELASRQHVRDICAVVERALAEAGAGWADLGGVAVTEGPGLVGSLLVGVSFAKAAAWARGLPLIGVNHIAGHIESQVKDVVEFPRHLGDPDQERFDADTLRPVGAGHRDFSAGDGREFPLQTLAGE